MLSGEVVVYKAFCPTVPVSDRCEHNEETSARTTYKAKFVGQFVLYWVDGSEVNKYSKCAVADRTNWKCEVGKNLDDSPIEIVMNNGKITDGFGGMGPNFYEVSAIQWHSLWLSNYLSGQPKK